MFGGWGWHWWNRMLRFDLAFWDLKRRLFWLTHSEQSESALDHFLLAYPILLLIKRPKRSRSFSMDSGKFLKDSCSLGCWDLDSPSLPAALPRALPPSWGLDLQAHRNLFSHIGHSKVTTPKLVRQVTLGFAIILFLRFRGLSSWTFPASLGIFHVNWIISS